MPQPAIEMPIWPVGTKTARSPAALAAAVSSSVTVILPIAQSVPTVCTMRAGTPRPAPLGVERPAGTRRRSRNSSPRAAAAATSSGSRPSSSCSPASTCMPSASASSSAAFQAGGSLPPAGATPMARHCAPSAAASATVATIGTGLLAYGTTSIDRWPACSESTTATTWRSP